ncbi:unnamed protein product [Danaus chrysippus]|uniref:(African queen) hypothetical protein n=1 Tax=Danaus chrysippus TaxID=151541 RepID=A0A8J2QCX2_9NEOP|nr:unnamed protein product [Danaus chrysippus]
MKRSREILNSCLDKVSVPVRRSADHHLQPLSLDRLPAPASKKLLKSKEAIESWRPIVGVYIHSIHCATHPMLWTLLNQRSDFDSW